MKKFLLFNLLICSAFQINAQCTISQTGGTTVVAGSGFLWGQGFMTTCAGNLNYVQFTADANGTINAGTLNIYNGNSVTGSVYSQSFPAFNVTAGNPIRITLSSTFVVSAATQYTFEFFVNLNNLATFSNVYAGGSAWQNSTIANNADFDFEVNITAPSAVLQLEHAEEISLYPNPGRIVRIDFGSHPFIGDLELISIQGQKIFQTKVEGTSTDLDLSAFASGMYFVRLSSENRSSIFRVIKE